MEAEFCHAVDSALGDLPQDDARYLAVEEFTL